MSSPIDPERLLNAVGPLLDLNGGIKSSQAAKRFINVMLDARKLVHRCVYLNILKATSDQDIRKELLCLGGWTILHDWLNEAQSANYWSVVKELLELFLELPLSVDLLKLNITPKIVRHLSKSDDLDREVKLLAADLVIIWKDIIAGETASVVDNNVYVQSTAKTNNPTIKLISKNNNHIILPVKLDPVSSSSPSDKSMFKSVDPNIDLEESEDTARPASPVNLPKLNTNKWSSPGNMFEKMKPKEMASFADAISSADVQIVEQNKNRPKTAKSYPSKFRSGFDVEPEQPPAKKAKPLAKPDVVSKAVAGSKITNATKNPIPSGGIKRPSVSEGSAAKISNPLSSSSVGEKKFKSSPTNVLDSLLPPLVVPLSSSDHSQTPSTSTTVTSPTVTTPPALVKPKAPPPKTVQMIESASFMAALEGNAAQKASLVRKKKVLPKQSSTGTIGPAATTTTTTGSALSTTSSASIPKPQFYKEIDKPSLSVERSPQRSSMGPNKDGKKRVRWAVDNELVQIQYFEIDETERINVNRIKAWGDLKHFEMHREREFMEAARKQRYRETQTEEVYFPWKLISFDGTKDIVEPGSQSGERQIQAERQKNILAEVYLPGMPLPDSPKEPEFMERIPQQEPILIPLDDTSTGTAQLPPELNKLLEGLKQSGMMPNPNMMASSNTMNMPRGGMMPPPAMQQNMNRPPNMPPMMNTTGLLPPPPNTYGPPASMMPMSFPPGNNGPPMHNGFNNGGGPPPGNFSHPRNNGPPPGYGPNMNMPPRNWGPAMNGPPHARRPGPPPHMRPQRPPPFSQNFRPPFRGGRPPVPAHHQQGPPPVRKFNKPCPFFQQDRCTFGDQCRYLHIKEADSEDYYSQQADEEATTDLKQTSTSGDDPATVTSTE